MLTSPNKSSSCAASDAYSQKRVVPSVHFRPQDSRVQLLPEAAHLSALHHPSGHGQPRTEGRPRCGTAERPQRQQQMVRLLERKNVLTKLNRKELIHGASD